MKNRKIITILMAIAFAIAVIFSVFFIFTLKKVQLDMVDFDKDQAFEIHQRLQGLEGKNLIFLSEQEIVDGLKDFTRYKVTSVKKVYPNVLKVEIEERKEVYRLVYESKLYCLDQTGFILEVMENQSISADRSIIDISLEGLKLTDQAAGDVINTSDNSFFQSVLGMAKTVNLSDCIKNITMRVGEVGSDIKDAIFSTYTGVDIKITKADIRGEDKIKKAFAVYDNEYVDFYKTFSTIEVVLLDGGEIRAIWIDPIQAKA